MITKLNQKVALPSGLIGEVVLISEKRQLQGLTSGRNQAKVLYDSESGMTEGWFSFDKLREVELVLKEPEPEEVEVPKKGEEPWIEEGIKVDGAGTNKTPKSFTGGEDFIG